MCRRFCGLMLFLILALPADAGFWSPGFPELILPEGMQVEVISDGMQLNGLNAQILQLRSEQPRSDVIQRFAQTWRGRVVRTRIGDSEILAHRDGDFLITLQLDAVGTGHTRGLLTVTDILAALDEGRAPAMPAWDMPAGSTPLQTLTANDVGRASHMLVLHNLESASQNLHFYRSYFHDLGFQPLTRGAMLRGEHAGAMILSRGAEQINVAVAEGRGGSYVTIVQVRH